MGGAADFQVGVPDRIRERRAKKNCTPTFPNVGYKQANISRGLLGHGLMGVLMHPPHYLHSLVFSFTPGSVDLEKAC